MVSRVSPLVCPHGSVDAKNGTGPEHRCGRGGKPATATRRERRSHKLSRSSRRAWREIADPGGPGKGHALCLARKEVPLKRFLSIVAVLALWTGPSAAADSEPLPPTPDVLTKNETGGDGRGQEPLRPFNR